MRWGKPPTGAKDTFRALSIPRNPLVVHVFRKKGLVAPTVGRVFESPRARSKFTNAGGQPRCF